jgi:hypothetical protein
LPYYPDVDAWTDERLDDLAATLRPLPAEVARQAEAIERLTEDTQALGGEMRSLREELTGEMRALRADFSASQRQLAHIGWGLVFALIAAVTAIFAAAVL